MSPTSVRDLLLELSAALEANEVRYALIGASRWGSARHHRSISWSATKRSAACAR